MATFVVRLAYDWVVQCYRELEIEAINGADAERQALELSRGEPEFWTESMECDGEASETVVIDIKATSSI